MNEQNKIVIIQSGSCCDSLITTSVLIGLSKKYPGFSIYWIGKTDSFALVKFNKRIKKRFDIEQDLTFETLTYVYNPNLCINFSIDKKSINIQSSLNAADNLGFSKNGPLTKQSEFFNNVINNKLKTNKTILDIYYNLCGLRWDGEGYGLSYFPKTKQAKEYGKYIESRNITCLYPEIKISKNILQTFDSINEYKDIHTDNEFIVHSSIALKKNITFYSNTINYQIEYFKKGQTVNF